MEFPFSHVSQRLSSAYFEGKHINEFHENNIIIDIFIKSVDDYKFQSMYSLVKLNYTYQRQVSWMMEHSSD